MVDLLFHIATILATLGCGLVAGIFLIFSNTVMGALAQLTPSQGMAAMQNINRIILNPVFLTLFFGTAATCILVSVSMLWRWHLPGTALLLTGSLLYLVGVILVTVVFNVPMNEALDKVDPQSAKGDKMWADYLTKWTAWNHVRTIAALLGAASFMLAL